MAGGKLLHSTGSSAQLCEDLEGWDGEWGGCGGWVVGPGGTGYVYTYGWFELLYSKNQHNTVKQLSSN